MAASTRRLIVLHFDLNRTILMSDASGGRTMENTVNYLLSECTWGYVHPKDPSQWVCVSEASSIEPPAVPVVRIDGADVAVPLVTYKHFVDTQYPYQSVAEVGAETTVDQVKAFNKEAKKQRTKLQSAFTSDDGPGAPVIESFRSVMEHLHFPSGPIREAAKKLAMSLPPSRVQEAWSEGRYYLLPSFVQLLLFLATAREQHDIKLVLRTFGDDVPDVALELEMLSNGTHPLGVQVPASFCFNPNGENPIGTFERFGDDDNGTTLSVRSLQKKTSEGGIYKVSDALGKITGYSAIQQRLHEMLQRSSIVALRDHWQWWSAHGEAGEYGKLLLIDETATSDVTMFFDDHIEAEHAHIVDVRSVNNGHSIPFSTSRNKYLHRVEPFEAIVDQFYFVKSVQALLG